MQQARHTAAISALGGGVGRGGVQDHPQLHSEFEASLACKATCFNSNNQHRAW